MEGDCKVGLNLVLGLSLELLTEKKKKKKEMKRNSILELNSRQRVNLKRVWLVKSEFGLQNGVKFDSSVPKRMGSTAIL